MAILVNHYSSGHCDVHHGRLVRCESRSRAAHNLRNGTVEYAIEQFIDARHSSRGIDPRSRLPYSGQWNCYPAHNKNFVCQPLSQGGRDA
jgi:hypothetical protein